MQLLGTRDVRYHQVLQAELSRQVKHQLSNGIGNRAPFGASLPPG